MNRCSALIAGTLIATVWSAGTLAAVGRMVGLGDVSPTGEATYSIPITVPAGINGMTPELAFVYGHRVTEGLAGVGWGISGLSQISRCAKSIAQDGATDNFDLARTDRLCVDGVQLRLTSGTYGYSGSQYRSEIDSISRYTAHGSAGNGPAYFVVDTKDGLSYEYGNSSDSRIESLATGYTTTALTWALNKISDRNGNEIVFNYIEDGAPYGGHRIDTITYRSNPAQGVSSIYEIDFVYETQPSGDTDEAFASGGKVEDTQRLTDVYVYYTGSNPDTVVRRYKVEYEAALSSSNRSRVESIQECAGFPLECFDATEFTYQDGTVDFDSAVSTGTPIPSTVLALDLNGDGLSDIAYSSSTGSGYWHYQLANSSGGYGPAQTTTIANTNHAEAIVIDHNHDGFEDILVPYSGGTWHAIHGSSTGLGSPVDTGAPDSSTAGNATALDLNGDGRDDLVWGENVGASAHSRLKVRYRNTSGNGFSSTATTLFNGGTGNTQLYGSTLFTGRYAQNRETHFDVNGDGIDDIAVVTETLGGPPWEPIEFYQTDIILGGGAGTFNVLSGSSVGLPIDINGDGYTDIAYQEYTTGPLKFRISNGKTLNPITTGQSLSGYSFGFAVATDFNNDGMQDLLVPHTSSDKWYFFESNGSGFETGVDTGASTSGATRRYAIDANGDGLVDIGYVNSSGVYAHLPHSGVKPDLLKTATDAHDNSITFNYAPITQDAYTKSSGASFPDQNYIGPLHVVTSAVITTGAGSGTYTLTYEYENAVFNLSGRGLSPFEVRIVTDSRNDIDTVDEYRTDFPYRGRQSLRQVKQPDGTVIQEIANTWSKKTAGTGNQDYHYPYVSVSTEKNYEVGGAFNGNQINTVVTTTAVDSYGTPTSIEKVTTEHSNANGLNAGATITEKLENTDILNNVTGWCLGKPGTTKLINSHTLDATYGATITRTLDRVWDTTSKCRVTQEIVEPLSTDYKVTRSIYYDAFGNINSETVTGVGMAGRTSLTNWGSTGQFPESVTNPLNQATTFTWDLVHGQLETSTDPNGLQVTWIYDVFGRLKQRNAVEGTYVKYTLSDCNAANSYCGTALDRARVEVKISSRETNGSEIRADYLYLDKLGRTVQTERQTMAGTHSRVRTKYDSLGRIEEQSTPSFATNPAYYSSVVYDLINRPTKTERPIDENNATLQSTLIDYKGLTIVTTDAELKTSTKILDALGRVYRSKDHDGYYQQFDLDAFGNVRRVYDGTNTLQEATYAYGLGAFKITSNDIDLGEWEYGYNALGELTAYNDANTSGSLPTTATATLTYDKLGRPLTRAEPEGTTTWTWGTSAAQNNIGRLVSISSPGHSESYTFDNYGRLSQRTTVADTTYLTNFGYNATTGLLETIEYPESTSSYRLKIKREYAYGLLQKISDHAVPTTVYWTADDVDAWGNVVDESLGSLFEASYDFDEVTGRIGSIQSGPSATPTARQNLSYTWDKVGNLTQRKDNNDNLSEVFYYDNLHRLESSTLDTGSGAATNLELTYDLMGNIMSKSDIGTGTWTYHATKKHAVTAVPGFTFDYDDNGNQVERDNGTSIDQITWTSYNHPSEIENGSKTHAFYYDGYRNRWKQVYDNGTASETTIFVGDLLEKRSEGSYTEYRHYIRTDNRAVALVTRPSTGTVPTRYLLRDHQGGVAEIVDGIAADDVSLSYRAFGERRDPDDWDSAFSDAALVADATDRGYTGHTNLESHTLIHMNGRVMDSLTGRFLSPDPFIPHPGMTQSFNRYSYVQNRPLSLVDPSGFTDCFDKPDIPCDKDGAPFPPGESVSPLNGEAPESRDLNDLARRIAKANAIGTPNAQWGLANNVSNDMPVADVAAAPMLQDRVPWHQSNAALFARAVGSGAIDAFTPVGDIKDISTAYSNGRYWTAAAFAGIGVASYLCIGAKQACKGLVSRLFRLDACCFVAGTLVATENGLVPIEDIEEGDRVWSRDPETGETVLKPVTALIRRHEREIWEVEVVHADGTIEVFETTDDHPWWIEGAGWVETADLSVGQQVTTRRHELSQIRRIVKTDRVDATYNLTVADFETYFVGEQQILVHNCNVPKGGAVFDDVASAAANRLGFDPADVAIRNGVADIPIIFTSSVSRADIRAVAGALRTQGATSVRVNTGPIINPTISGRIERALEQGKDFLGFSITRTGDPTNMFILEKAL